MRSIYSGLLSALMMLSGAAASAQQITIQVDVRVICGLVPVEQQSLCMQDLSPNRSLEQGLKFCQTNVYAHDQMACFSKVRAGVYSENALNTCSKVGAFDRLNCLDTIRDGYYENEALLFCTNKVYAHDQLSCLKIVKNKSITQSSLNFCGEVNAFERNNCLTVVKEIYLQAEAAKFCTNQVYAHDNMTCVNAAANKSFLTAELNACANVSAFDRVNCIKSMGQRVITNPVRYNPNGQFPVPTVQMFPRSTQVQPQIQIQVPQQKKCDVHNSNSSTGVTVSKARFMEYAAKVASEAGSCLVAHVNGETESRTLFSARGRALAENMSESKASDMKKSYGFDRCKVLICR